MAKGRKTGGRAPGTPNRTTSLLKDAILEAATRAGGKDELVGYLRTQASANPTAFMALLGRVLPMQIGGDPQSPIVHEIRRTLVRPQHSNG